jgi:hypothetical protein
MFNYITRFFNKKSFLAGQSELFAEERLDILHHDFQFCECPEPEFKLLATKNLK